MFFLKNRSMAREEITHFGNEPNKDRDKFMFDAGKLHVGLNYWSSAHATRMWKNYDSAVIEKDLALLEEHGISLIRVFPLWDDFQPVKVLQYGGARGTFNREVCFFEGEKPLPDTMAGRAGMDQTMLDHFRDFCDIAEKHHIKLIVAIMTAHMTGRHYMPPAFENLDMMTDPFALKWEMKFYDCFVRTFKDHPAIAAWETGNEMNYTAPVKNADHAWVWTKMMHDIIRLADPDRPIVGVMAESLQETRDAGRWRITDQGELSDLGSVHRYDILNAGAADGWMHLRNLYRAAAECRIISDIGGKPCFTEETGNWRNLALSMEGVSNALNALLWTAWAEDCRAFLWWCAFDQSQMHFAPYHWGDWAGLEHGVFDAERNAHPAADTLKKFSNMLKNSPVQELPATVTDAVCIIDDLECGFTSAILARQAGINFKFQAAREALADSKVYFLPSADSRAGLSLENWDELRRKVADGATCYISSDDCILPGLREFCGMQIARRQAVKSPIECTVAGDELKLQSKLQKTIEPESAEVVLSDKNGKPLMLRNKYGKGTVYTLLFALETIIAQTPGTFESAWWKIYSMIVPKNLLLTGNDCSVIITEHPISDRKVAVVAVNCSDQNKVVVWTPAENWQIANIIGDGAADGNKYRFPAGGGALFILEKQG